MTKNTLISFLGPHHPGLIPKTTKALFELGGNLGEFTFAVLGEAAELTLIYEMPDRVNLTEVEDTLRATPEFAEGELKVVDFQMKTRRGPSSRVTHRIILSGQDRPGFIAKFTALLDEYGANIVRVNAGKVEGATGDQYIAVFAISLRDEKAPDCLAAIVHTAGELKLSFRYETA